MGSEGHLVWWGRHSCLPLNRGVRDILDQWGRHSCLPLNGGVRDILVPPSPFKSTDGRQECLPHQQTRMSAPPADRNVCPTSRQECLPHQQTGMSALPMHAGSHRRSPHSSVYFFADPLALCTGYFASFFAIFFRNASPRSILCSSAMASTQNRTSASSSASSSFFPLRWLSNSAPLRHCISSSSSADSRASEMAMSLGLWNCFQSRSSRKRSASAVNSAIVAELISKAPSEKMEIHRPLPQRRVPEERDGLFHQVVVRPALKIQPRQ